MLSGLINAVQMNQNGASWLFAGHLDQAATCFTAALRQMNFPLHSPRSRPFPIPSIFYAGCRDERGNYAIEGRRGYLYGKPFFFNTQAVISEAESAGYVAVILFNLALAFHIEGRAFQDGGYFLREAQTLYHSCLTLLNGELHYDPSNVLIACLNNLACVTNELYSFDETFQALFLLTTLLKDGRVRKDTINRDDLTDVVLNIPLLLMPICASAA